jgi:hypothetical protein
VPPPAACRSLSFLRRLGRREVMLRACAGPPAAAARCRSGMRAVACAKRSSAVLRVAPTTVTTQPAPSSSPHAHVGHTLHGTTSSSPADGC